MKSAGRNLTRMDMKYIVYETPVESQEELIDIILACLQQNLQLLQTHHFVADYLTNGKSFIGIKLLYVKSNLPTLRNWKKNKVNQSTVEATLYNTELDVATAM